MRRIINSKKIYIFISEVSIIIIFIYRKLGSVGPVPQKNKLPSPNSVTFKFYLINQSSDSYWVNIWQIDKFRLNEGFKIMKI